jgi:hypothetical protein
VTGDKSFASDRLLLAEIGNIRAGELAWTVAVLIVGFVESL